MSQKSPLCTLKSVLNQTSLGVSSDQLCACHHRGYVLIMLFSPKYVCQHPAQDCAVSEWSFWSGCAKPCQPSVRVRVRHIEQQPSNNGEPCPSLKQQAGCREYRDHQGGHCGVKSGIQKQKSLWFCTLNVTYRNNDLVSLIRSCIHHKHGVWQGKAQTWQLWKPPGLWVGFISCSYKASLSILKLHMTSGIFKFKSWKVHKRCRGLTSFQCDVV